MRQKRNGGNTMKKLISTFLVVAALLCGVCPSAYACTTILVGKDASADGSAYAGRTNDDVEMLSAKIEIFPASKGPGTYVFVDPENGAEVTLPKANHRCIIEPVYNKCPDIWWESGFNDAGVGISATETIRINDAVLAIDPFTKSGISEANIPRLVLPYISSAKEGVMRLGSLVEQYGMTAPEAVAFIDDDGIWYIEVLSGHQWAAHRLPDDEYACIGNDCLLDFYNPDDTENWIGSAGVKELAEKAGTYTELDGKFHLALSFSAGKRDYSQLRIWASRRYFNNVSPNSYNVNADYTFSLRPAKKIALKDIFALTRDRHENTPMATDVVGNTRPIAIDRTGQVHMFQYKKGNVPVMWSCLTAPEFGVYLPVYNNIKWVPDGLAVSTPIYDVDSFSWQLRLISDLAVTNRAQYSELVRSPYVKLEDKFIKEVSKMPAPTAEEATEYLQDVSDDAWDVMDEVRTALFTKVSQDAVLATKTLGRD